MKRRILVNKELNKLHIDQKSQGLIFKTNNMNTDKKYMIMMKLIKTLKSLRNFKKITKNTMTTKEKVNQKTTVISSAVALKVVVIITKAKVLKIGLVAPKSSKMAHMMIGR